MEYEDINELIFLDNPIHRYNIFKKFSNYVESFLVENFKIKIANCIGDSLLVIENMRVFGNVMFTL